MRFGAKQLRDPGEADPFQLKLRFLEKAIRDLKREQRRINRRMRELDQDDFDDNLEED